MLPFDEAQARIVAAAVRLEAETVPLDRARGRVLAEDVRAAVDLPAFDASTMDGYALRAADCAGEAPFELDVDGETTPGGSPLPLAAKSARRIFTGAPLPAGADAVEMQEETTLDAATKRVRLARAPVAGRFVRKAGEDLKRGEVALTARTRLSSCSVALAASLDRASVSVSRKPRVSFIVTGDELRAPGTSGTPTSIPDSASLALAELAAHAGALVVAIHRAPDDRAATEDAAARALAASDVIVTIGGASVGAHDHARAALESLGVEIDFWRVAMKPGKPVAFGKRGNARVLAIPGNPASAMITFAMFGVPLLRAMQSDASPLPRVHRATLDAKLQREPGRTELLRAELVAASEPTVRILRHQASGSLLGMAKADALVRVESDVGMVDAGAAVPIYLASEIFP